MKNSPIKLTIILTAITLHGCSYSNKEPSAAMNPQERVETGYSHTSGSEHYNTNTENVTETENSIGGPVGYYMDSDDRYKVFDTLENTPKNNPARWTNASTGATYTIVNTSEIIKVSRNPKCKNYRATVMITGQTKKHYGTACQESNGTWKDSGIR